MEPKVKERITGAAVLVALGVWLIPWVLDGPDAPDAGAAGGSEPSIMLPAAVESAPIRTQTVELRAREPGRRSEAADSASDGVEDAPARLAVVVSGSTEPGQARATAEDAPSPDRTPVNSAAATADSAPESAGGWWVQLGAFSDGANASQLVSRVASYGFTARVSELTSGGRVMHRVRVGAFSSENEAEAAASSLSAHNFPVDVIPPE